MRKFGYNLSLRVMIWKMIIEYKMGVEVQGDGGCLWEFLGGVRLGG